MCKGLAVIVEMLENKTWKVYAKQGISSHDELLHELHDGLKYGEVPHLKFEILFPNTIVDDIQQDIEYPEGFTEIIMGKKVAKNTAFKAVSDFYYNNYSELSIFNRNMYQKANLSWANLSGADLSENDLSEANLSGTNLSGADLSRANLSGANLSGANLSGADLSENDLSEANLSGTNLSGADLSRANLSGANLSWATKLSGADLSRADLSGTNLSWVNLSRTNLSGANLSGTKYDKHTKFPIDFKITKNMILV